MDLRKNTSIRDTSLFLGGAKREIQQFRRPHEQDEEKRLHALHELCLLDTPESEAFDRITRMVAHLFQVPIAAISLTDRHRQWFKSHIGTAGREIVRHRAPCSEVSRSAHVVVIEDLKNHPEYLASPLAEAGVRFYAGAPLITEEGFTIGALCALDKVSRSVTEEEIARLQDLAALVMDQINFQHAAGRRHVVSGLPNRFQFLEDLSDLDRISDSSHLALCIDLLEPNHSLNILGILGTQYLDDFVRAAIAVVQAAVPKPFILYHISPTALGIIVDQAHIDSWSMLMHACSRGLALPIECTGIPVTAGVVFGIAYAEPHDAGPVGLLRKAISAVNAARAEGSAYAIYSDARDMASRRRFRILSDFGKALAAPDQLSLHYQPRISGSTGLCSSVEALLRWTHPSLGTIGPNEFIPLVEQTSMAKALTEWVMAAACKQLAQWRQDAIEVAISINVSARNLEEPDFAQRLIECAAREAAPACRIELEFTESALIVNPDAVLAQMERITHFGFSISIDDFGSGYSNFSYLRKIPARTVKLDQSFVRDIDSDVRSRKIAVAMIGIAHDLGLNVVAEGVETEKAMLFLQTHACDEMQGYFICRPGDQNAISEWLRANAKANVSLA